MMQKINNFDTCKILKNRFKKNKNSSKNATLIYLLFDIPLVKITTEKINESNNTTKGLPEAIIL